MTNTYADIAERDAAIAQIKQRCRDLVQQLDQHLPGEISYMPIWVDGVWGDYWYVERNGVQAGEVYYDGFGPVVKGDALGALVYEAGRAAELAAARS
jgi:hypothetical protein